MHYRTTVKLDSIETASSMLLAGKTLTLFATRQLRAHRAPFLVPKRYNAIQRLLLVNNSQQNARA
jgi:hypothetical protein